MSEIYTYGKKVNVSHGLVAVEAVGFRRPM